MCKTTSRDLKSRPSFLVGVLPEPREARVGELVVGRDTQHSEAAPYVTNLVGNQDMFPISSVT